MSLLPESTLLPSHPHRRLNLLTGKWILVSPHRTQRPWLGQEEKTAVEEIPEYDPDCYLCPANSRASGDKNPAYSHTYVFVNDYSAVLENQDDYSEAYTENDITGSDDLLVATPATGRCLVLSFAASHRDTFADLSPKDILIVVNSWTSVYIAHISKESLLYPFIGTVQQSIDEQMGDKGVGKGGENDHTFPLWIEGLSNVNSPKSQYRYLQIIENKGPAMGCSNKHPHGQVWITDILPDEPGTELRQMSEYRKKNPTKRNMLMEYAKREIGLGHRVVFETEYFVALCPWWASWPFEVLVLPRPDVSRITHDTDNTTNTHIRCLLDLCSAGRADLGVAINRLSIIYDNLFEVPFPYSMGIHQAPINPLNLEELEDSCLHLHFYPPLLRSAKVRKFWAGYELLTEAQRDLTPEVAVARLRACDRPLYRTGNST